MRGKNRIRPSPSQESWRTGKRGQADRAARDPNHSHEFPTRYTVHQSCWGHVLFRDQSRTDHHHKVSKALCEAVDPWCDKLPLPVFSALRNTKPAVAALFRRAHTPDRKAPSNFLAFYLFSKLSPLSFTSTWKNNRLHQTRYKTRPPAEREVGRPDNWSVKADAVRFFPELLGQISCVAFESPIEEAGNSFFNGFKKFHGFLRYWTSRHNATFSLLCKSF